MKGMKLLIQIFQDHNNRSHEVECANALLHHLKVCSAEDKASHVYMMKGTSVMISSSHVIKLHEAQ